MSTQLVRLKDEHAATLAKVETAHDAATSSHVDQMAALTSEATAAARASLLQVQRAEKRAKTAESSALEAESAAQVASNEAARCRAEAERASKQASEEASLRQRASARANEAEQRSDELTSLLAGLQAQSAAKLQDQQEQHAAALAAQAERESARLAAAESENARLVAVLESTKLQGESALVRLVPPPFVASSVNLLCAVYGSLRFGSTKTRIILAIFFECLQRMFSVKTGCGSGRSSSKSTTSY